MTEAMPLKRTPLYGLHRRLGARMTAFAGYELPLHYGSILKEQRHARSHAVLFDVSHIGQIVLSGDDGTALERLVVSDIRSLPAGKVRYTLMTNAEGGIIDDFLVVQGGSGQTLAVNGTRRDDDLAYLREYLPDSCKIKLMDAWTLIALQGPSAATVLGRLAPASRLMLFMTAEKLKIAGVNCVIARSGFTGEDGFEIAVPAESAERIADLLLQEPEVLPGGLGARDVLRIEAGFCLHGRDIDATTTPIEADLAWTIQRRRREEGGFVGDDVILRELIDGPKRRRIGIKLQGSVIARPGNEIVDRWGWRIGGITSGTFSPTIDSSIAIGYLNVEHLRSSNEVHVLVRGQKVSGEVIRLPFVEHRFKQ